VSVRDTQRSKVYAAEEFVRTLFDRASEHGNRTIEFFGTNLTLPPEARFGSVESVRRYVDDVLALGSVRERWPDVAALSVRPRRGLTAAHYERHGDEASIAVPERRTTSEPDRRRHEAWALRELVVLHEIAHHLCDAAPPHGPEFVATFCALAEAVMGPEVAHVLRVVYAKEGVR
jgi:putative metallohydrolase (TIGR04338 family)